MTLWSLIITIAVAVGLIIDIMIWQEQADLINIRTKIYYDIVFLFIAVAMLYRIWFMQKKGEKEKLKMRIKELEEKLKELEGKEKIEE